MKVSQPVSITRFIKANELTFEIPVYQRNYTWDIDNCDKLFEDIITCIEENKKHYFGNIVYYEAGEQLIIGFDRYILIDGQQRITSIMLLLAAIRDEESDGATQNKLTSTYLTNTEAEEKIRVKLKQVESDRSVYESIIEDGAADVLKNSVVFRNYNRFKQLVRNTKSSNGLTTATLLSGIDNLEIIAIDLESEKPGAESPQIIFESINATGKPLSTADLLRNFLLLEVGISKQAEYYHKYWLSIETNVGNEYMSDFVRRFLTLMTNEDVKRGTEYREFKKQYKVLFSNAEDAILELNKYSKYYMWVKDPLAMAKVDKTTGEALQGLDDLRLVPATPVLMWLLEKADVGEINFGELNDTFNIIASWSFRARVTGIINTGEIGNILTVKILEILKRKDNNSSYPEYLHFELSNYQLRDIYPSDDAFKSSFVHYDFYKNYRTYIQIKLEKNAKVREAINDKFDIELESIEHIMPQKIEQEKWPNISVSEHAEWINTIGNLTPMNMKDNPAASNGSFEEKRPFIEKSAWQLTKDVAKYKKWDIEMIQKRGFILADEAINVWKAPAKRTREIVAVAPDDKKLLQKFMNWIDEFDLQGINIDESKTLRSYLRFGTAFMESIIPPRDDTSGGWRNGKAYYYELYTEKTGYTSIQLTFNFTKISDQQKVGQNLVLNSLAIEKPNDKKQYITPKAWRLEYKEGDDVLKEEVRRVLEQEIPQLEQQVRNYIENSK